MGHIEMKTVLLYFFPLVVHNNWFIIKTEDGRKNQEGQDYNVEKNTHAGTIGGDGDPLLSNGTKSVGTLEPVYQKPKKLIEKKNKFRSGVKCPKPDIEDWKNKKNLGYCRDRDKCNWVAPGETIKTVGCTVYYCANGGQSWIKENGCQQCKLPGKENIWWIPIGDAQQDCKDKENPCDLCSCKAGNPPTLVVDKEGCKKGKKCVDLETGKISDHRAGETWDCWIEDRGCYAKCTCEDTGNGTITGAQFGSDCIG